MPSSIACFNLHENASEPLYHPATKYDLPRFSVLCSMYAGFNSHVFVEIRQTFYVNKHICFAAILTVHIMGTICVCCS